MRRDRNLADLGQPGGALDPLPRVDRAHREDVVLADGLVGPQRLEFGPGPPGQPHDPRLAALAGHVRDALNEVAPTQRHQLRHPQSAIIEEADQGMVARPVFDRLEQCEDLALAEDPLGELLVRPRRGCD